MDREKVISKLEKEVQRTYSTKTTVFQNGEKVSEEINTHREPCVRIPIEMADKILALLKEQKAVERKTGHWIYESQFADCWSNTCSECGKRFTNAIDSFAPYCWNCGAKMEGR